MELLYKSEHLNCINYMGGENPMAELVELPEGSEWEIFSKKGKILFVLDGELEFPFGSHGDNYINKRHMLYLPQNVNFRVTALVNTKFLIVRIQTRIQFCDCYQMETLMEDSVIERIDKEDFSLDTSLEETKSLHPCLMQIKQPLWLLLEQFSACLFEGLKCTHYIEAKIKEIFYMFRAFYTKQELASFFSEALNKDSNFAEKVHANYMKFNNVADFAKLLNYTSSGFEKRFFRTFGTSVYQWMIEQKSKRIFHEINTGNKKIKQISEEFNFSSPSAFNDFCKKHLNATPGEIRKNRLSQKVY